MGGNKRPDLKVLGRTGFGLKVRANRTYRLDDPFLPGATVLPGLAEQLDVLREDECPGEKAELALPKANLHLRQVSPEPILPADLKGSWEMVQLRPERRQKRLGCSPLFTKG